MVSNPKGKQAQVMGYYTQEAAEQLRKLSEKFGLSQAALLREALDDLLSLNDVVPATDRVREVRNALKKARTQLVAYQKEIELHGLDMNSLRNCLEAIGAIDRANEEFGKGRSRDVLSARRNC